jgi:glycosyltransferase involved in cell wall biosynthesis
VTRAVAYFGTYDPDYPRNAVVIAGLRELGVTVYEVQASLPPLSAKEMATAAGAARLASALIGAHMRLVSRLRFRPRVDALVVGYPGHLIVPLARTAAALCRTRLVFDPLVSLSDTFVGDRALVGARGWRSTCMRAADAVAFRLPDLVLADTDAHGAYYRSMFGLAHRKVATLPVGAASEPAATGVARELSGEPVTVLQYGKWSPLHGAETVIAAADILRDEPFRFLFAGEGQLSRALRREIGARGLTTVEWLGSLSPVELRARVLSADVCLGVFGASDKAARVVPNKVHDALSCGRPVVTSDTPAARELLADHRNALLVPPSDPRALAGALRELQNRGLRALLGQEALSLHRRSLTPAAVAERLLATVQKL